MLDVMYEIPSDDFIENCVITEEVAKVALDLMDVDKLGLDHVDRNMLSD